jgi:penicillin-binding protein 1A
MTLLKRLLMLLVAGALAASSALVALYLTISPQLPDIDQLRDIRLQVPMRIHDRNGQLIAEFGEKRRIPLQYDQIPRLQIEAFLAAEDDRFFDHFGVDYQGLLRAAWRLLLTGEKRQGGSTITMQVARNFFLSREKTYLRKLSEIFLAVEIEQQLTKEEIIALYLNKIFLGQRAYGLGAAAQVYYGKRVDQLTLAQMALLAGLPKAPARDNPVADPDRARERRAYVLGRMLELGKIDRASYQQAVDAPITASRHSLPIEVDAPYIAEMVRQEMISRYGDSAYETGLRIQTTIDGTLQSAADLALRRALHAYDRRHGYRGAEGHIELPPSLDDRELAERIDPLLAGTKRPGDLRPAVVTSVGEKSVRLYAGNGEWLTIGWDGLKWARRHLSATRLAANPRSAADIVRAGDLVRISPIEESDQPLTEIEGPPAPPEWMLSQLPAVEGALVALDSHDGAIIAISGGYDFYRSKFNRALQAERQPGSNFKPFIYSAALEHGLTPASLINDAPVVHDDPSLEKAWRPENYSGKFYGPTRIRLALTHSRNLVSIRLLDTIGIDHAMNHVARFGFNPDTLPANLSLALGSGVVTPLQLVSGYAILANGGYRVTPYFIDHIDDAATGHRLHTATPDRVCPECQEQLATKLPADESSGDTGSQPLVPTQTPTAIPLLAGEQEARLHLPGQQQAPVAEIMHEPGVARRVVSPQNVYMTSSMLQDVIQHGTGRRARILGRSDLAGKTGTTNDQRDAWFSGYNGRIVATTWVGFDNMTILGNRETGSRAALPMWIDFMADALRDQPETPLNAPPGMVTLRIDPASGLSVGSDFDGAIFETLPANRIPERLTTNKGNSSTLINDQTGSGDLPTSLF